MRKNLSTLFFGEIYSYPAIKTYQTIKILYNIIDEMWNIKLMVMSDYQSSNNEGFRHISFISGNAWKKLGASR